MSTATRVSIFVVLSHLVLSGVVGCTGIDAVEGTRDDVAAGEPLGADVSGASSSPLVADVRQYFHHLDHRWVLDDDHVPPGLPLTDEVRAQFARKLGTIADTRRVLTEHGIDVSEFDDDVSLVDAPTFDPDGRAASARFTVQRIREFQHAKFDQPQRVTVSDDYIVNFVRSQDSTGLGRWLISAIATSPVPPDDAGTGAPPIAAVGTPASAAIPSTFQFAPKAGVSLRTKGALQTAVVDGPLEGLDYAKMAAYAILWSTNETINPEYPNLGNNCQNFVSQALFFGGWPEVEANVLQVDDVSKWDGHIAFTNGTPNQETHTWRVTSDWMEFATDSGRVQWMPNLFDAALGDVIQTDWDPNDKPNGSVDHAMIVSSWDEVWGPHISQQSKFRNDIPLVLEMQIAAESGKTDIVWYLART